MAYSIAVGLDEKSIKMSRLHAAWNELSADYERLWNHWYEHDAEDRYEELLKRGRAVWEMGVTEAPYNEKLLEKWQDITYALYSREPSTTTNPA